MGMIFFTKLPISKCLQLSLRKWCLEKHKSLIWFLPTVFFLQVYIGRPLGVFKNPSVVCSLNEEWVMVKLSCVNCIMDGQLLVQILPALPNTGIASKLNLRKVELAFCRGNSVMLSGKEIYIWWSNVMKEFVVIFFGLELNVRLISWAAKHLQSQRNISCLFPGSSLYLFSGRPLLIA